MRWVHLLLLCLAPTAAALVPYKAELALNLALCGSDVGYSTAAIANGDFFHAVDDDAGAGHGLSEKRQLPRTLRYQGVTFEQYAATLLPSSAATPTTPTTVKPSTANCTDQSAIAAFAAIEAERSRFLSRCAIDMGDIPVAYLYNNTLKHKITDTQFTAFLASSDCAAAIAVEKKAWGAIEPPCVLYDGALAFTTKEISAWTFTEYAERFYERSIPSTTSPAPRSTTEVPRTSTSTTAAPRPVAQSTAARYETTSALVVLALAAWGC
ncbi:hypothetical protein SPRG_14609 [Saprolegnia parasitica CBS 223.65]|uniref:SCP domain-containing protein n=1 Tax=Saprolegnia parasitica (strain CBS 223.65) TaxID=695850 RepID=A0A067BNS3_SAPPC|nr:hypothetical protein SPRG_14609 [Saprolegnia parasitica CBS 223.65]KDO20129.1 hypothetical protein SPRG_14609 [Saprolegnia parasitica CBS 223.65]|eukprot:XP_012209171.1 hypothetical protein SPRG_14609 [Saprolegnia parasitica CBS 223.65]